MCQICRADIAISIVIEFMGQFTHELPSVLVVLFQYIDVSRNPFTHYIELFSAIVIRFPLYNERPRKQSNIRVYLNSR